MTGKLSLAAKLLTLSLLITSSQALEVNIKEGVPYVDVDLNGKSIRIQRNQDTDHKLTGPYTKTSRPAPPFSIQPFQPIAGIETVTELDVIDFIAKEMNKNTGILVDARMQKWYEAGTIPGSTNLPFSILAANKNNPYIDKILGLLGANKSGEKWSFDKAQTLLIFDNGPWCQQGVRAMLNLVKLGYPKSKMKYYRGGMQYWNVLGLTTIQPNKK